MVGVYLGQQLDGAEHIVDVHHELLLERCKRLPQPSTAAVCAGPTYPGVAGGPSGRGWRTHRRYPAHIIHESGLTGRLDPPRRQVGLPAHTSAAKTSRTTF